MEKINSITRLINSLYEYEDNGSDFYKKIKKLIELLEWYRDVLINSQYD